MPLPSSSRKDSKAKSSKKKAHRKSPSKKGQKDDMHLEEEQEQEGENPQEGEPTPAVRPEVYLPFASANENARANPEAAAAAAAAAAHAAADDDEAMEDYGAAELEYDPTAYDCLHALAFEWPCLSFDVLRDALGEGRKAFPHAMYVVAGTQADAANKNCLVVARLTNLGQGRHGMRRGKNAKKSRHDDSSDDEDEEDSSDEGDYSSDEDEDSSDEEGGEGGGFQDAAMQAAGAGGSAADERPRLSCRLVAHHGGVNRVRSMPQLPNVVATWGETGAVQIWDVSAQLASIAAEDASEPRKHAPTGSQSTTAPLRVAPLHAFTGHRDEGYAIGWSPVARGALASGGCDGAIYTYDPAESCASWSVPSTPFQGHGGSVEDIAWSPTEAGVFASVGTDATLRIWDARKRNGAALVAKVSPGCDVNVLSWNALASMMVLTGDDDGRCRVWDLRNFGGGGGAPAASEFTPSAVADLHYPRGAAVTSVEWSPHESSVFVASSSAGVVNLWDLSLEADPTEELELRDQMGTRGQDAIAPDDLPPQLLFVHQGQTDIKESKFHSQIPRMVLSTAADGFNVWMPSNTGEFV